MADHAHWLKHVYKFCEQFSQFVTKVCVILTIFPIQGSLKSHETNDNKKKKEAQASEPTVFRDTTLV